jgi:hypothetical protein
MSEFLVPDANGALAGVSSGEDRPLIGRRNRKADDNSSFSNRDVLKNKKLEGMLRLHYHGSDVGWITCPWLCIHRKAETDRHHC